LQKRGFDIRAILHPTVEEGKERIRICIHSFNTEKEIKMCVASLEKLIV
jgi:8-amino-7-oxononanoate synthase